MIFIIVILYCIKETIELNLKLNHEVLYYPGTLTMDGLSCTNKYRIAALTDWNNDKKTDLILFTNNTHVSIWLWKVKYTFSFYRSIQILFPSNTSKNEEFQTAMVSDINNDKEKDIIVTTSQGNVHAILSPSYYILNHLLPIKINSLSMNVFSLYGPIENMNIIAKTNLGLTFFSKVKHTSSKISFATLFSLNQRYTGYSALSDFNFDCFPDIVLGYSINSMETRYEIYTDNNNFFNTAMNKKRYRNNFTNFDHSFKVPLSGDIFPTIADVFGTGGVDFVFPSCSNLQCSKYNSLEKQTPFNEILIILQNISNVCKDENCCSKVNFKYGSISKLEYNEYFKTNKVTNNFVRISLTHICNSTKVIFLESSPYYLSGIPMIRTSDWNNDHYQDFLISTTDGLKLLLSNGKKSWNCVSLKSDKVSFNNNYFFFNINNDRKSSIVSMIPDRGKFITFENTIDTSTQYYFNTIMIHYKNPDNLNSILSDSLIRSPYTVATSVVYRFQWADINQQTQTASYVHYVTSQNNALPNPIVHFGIGKTFGYIKNYVNSIRGMDTENKSIKITKYWTQYMVPNSQVVTIANPLNEPEYWKLHLLISPIQYMNIAFMFLVGGLGLLAIPIILLKFSEIDQDQKAKRLLAR